MRARAVLCALVICWLTAAAGCSRIPPAPADAEQARDALRTSLDTWKNAEALDALAKRSPPIHFQDGDSASGWLLKHYRVTKDDVPFGQQRRFFVHLELHGPQGKTAVKEVEYLVDTSPALVIVRVDD